MELGHLRDWEVTADVRVEYKEGSGVTAEYLISKVVDTSCSPQWSIFLQIPIYNEPIVCLCTIHVYTCIKMKKDVGMTPCQKLGLLVSLVFSTVSSLHPSSFLYLFHSFFPGPRHTCSSLALATRADMDMYGIYICACASVRRAAGRA